MKRASRTPFRDILESTRRLAAKAAWQRAGVASSLRRLAAANRDHAGAALLAQAKLKALQLATSLLPEEIRVTIDDDFEVGLLSVRWQGHGWFHLPANAALDEELAAAGAA